MTAPVVSLVVPDNVPVSCWPKPGKAVKRDPARQTINVALDRNDFQVIEKPLLWLCDEVLRATFRSRLTARQPVSRFDPDSSGAALTFTLLHIKVLLHQRALYVLRVDDQCQEKNRFS